METIYLSKKKKEIINSNIKLNVEKRILSSELGKELDDLLKEVKQKLYEVSKSYFPTPNHYNVLSYYGLLTNIPSIHYSIHKNKIIERTWSNKSDKSILKINFKKDQFEIVVPTTRSTNETYLFFKKVKENEELSNSMIYLYTLWDKLHCEIIEVTKAYMNTKINPYRTLNSLLKNHPDMKKYTKDLFQQSIKEENKTKEDFQKIIKSFENS